MTKLCSTVRVQTWENDSFRPDSGAVSCLCNDVS